MNVPFPIWNVWLVDDPLSDPDLFPLNVTDHVACVPSPVCPNVTAYVTCANVTVIEDGLAPATATLPAYVPTLMW